MDKPSIQKTAFNSPFRKWEYVKVPFGLAQAPAYFQELMTGILKDFSFAIAYLDNIIIFSKTPQEHLSHIRKVFENLRSAKLSMKMSKCNFFSEEIQYLGHILSAIASLQFWTADLDPVTLSRATEEVYSTFFYSTSTHTLCQQSDEILFGCFVITHEGYKSSSDTINLPTPLRKMPRIHHVSSIKHALFNPEPVTPQNMS